MKKTIPYVSGASIAKAAVAKGRNIGQNLKLTTSIIRAAVQRDNVESGGIR